MDDKKESANEDGEPDEAESSASSSLGRAPRFSTIEELLCERVYERAVNSSTTLRSQLAGSIGLTIADSQEAYLFEWIKEKPTIMRMEKTEADCLITITDRDLRRIAAGVFNPQVGMLTDKIRVSGKTGLAIYFFNLIAPAQSF